MIEDLSGIGEVTAETSDAWLTYFFVRRAETLRMESVSTRLDDETERLVRERAEERDVSMAEILRELIEKGLEYDEIEAERDRLQRKLTETNTQNDKVDTLATYVETERARQQRQLAREDALASAPPWRRLKWWATGTDPAEAIDGTGEGEAGSE